MSKKEYKGNSNAIFKSGQSAHRKHFTGPHALGKKSNVRYNKNTLYNKFFIYSISLNY